MKRNLDIEFLDLELKPDVELIKCGFENIEHHCIDSLNWKKFSTKPDVKFKIYYSQHAIYIKYDVLEKNIMALNNHINDPVYKDSCVEFFVSDGKDVYYNFEFNCIGTKYAGSGTSIKNTKPINREYVQSINTFPSLGVNTFKEKVGEFSWSLIVEIPIYIFYSGDVKEIKNSNMRGNFYKCGDDLTIPHYLSWNPIISSKPSFHEPNYFGDLKFK